MSNDMWSTSNLDVKYHMENLLGNPSGEAKSICINPEFNIGQEVYLKVDPEQSLHIVTGIRISPGAIRYEVTSYEMTRDCYEFELTPRKNLF